MKAFMIAWSVLAIGFSALCVAYKHKLDEANRYINRPKQIFVGSTNVIRILDNSDQLVLLIEQLSAGADSKPNLAATNLLLTTKYLPLFHYSNETFFIRLNP